MIAKLLCAIGLHLTGRSGQSCMHNVNVCSHCKRDVWFFFREERP